MDSVDGARRENAGRVEKSRAACRGDRRVSRGEPPGRALAPREEELHERRELSERRGRDEEHVGHAAVRAGESLLDGPEQRRATEGDLAARAVVARSAIVDAEENDHPVERRVRFEERREHRPSVAIRQHPRIRRHGAAVEAFLDDPIVASEMGLEDAGPAPLEGKPGSVGRVVSPGDRVSVAEDGFHVLRRATIRILSRCGREALSRSRHLRKRSYGYTHVYSRAAAARLPSRTWTRLRSSRS